MKFIINCKIINSLNYCDKLTKILVLELKSRKPANRIFRISNPNFTNFTTRIRIRMRIFFFSKRIRIRMRIFFFFQNGSESESKFWVSPFPPPFFFDENQQYIFEIWKLCDTEIRHLRYPPVNIFKYDFFEETVYTKFQIYTWMKNFSKKILARTPRAHLFGPSKSS